MKNHIAFKFLAILLCTCGLLCAVSGAIGIVLMTEFSLYDYTPEEIVQKHADSLTDHLAYRVAVKYANESLGNCSENLLSNYFGFWNVELSAGDRVFSYVASEDFAYILSDEAGKILDTGGNMPLLSAQSAGADSGIINGDTSITAPYLSCITARTASAYTTPEATAAVESENASGSDAPKPTSASYYEKADTADLTAAAQAAGEEIVSFDYYDEAAGEDVRAELIRRESPAYHFTLSLSASYTPLWELCNMLYPYRMDMIVLLAVGLLLFAAALVFLCCVAGRQPGTDEIRAGGLNRLPLDLYAAGVVALVLILVSVCFNIVDEMLAFSINPGYLTVLISSSVLICLSCVGFLFACAAQFRTGGGFWWRHSATAWVCTLLFRAVRWTYRLLVRFFVWLFRALPFAGRAVLSAFSALFRFISRLCSWLWSQILRLWHCFSRAVVRLYGMLPLIWQWLLCGGALLIVMLIATRPYQSGAVVLLCLAICAAIILYGAYSFGILLRSAKRMSAGDLDTKVDETHLSGSFKDFAGNLNDLAGVAVLSAQKQMKSERMKAELITNVSHDIKTPLTSIINYVDLLQKAHSEEEAEQYLEVLARQSQRLKKLIEDLMELSKATTGNLTVDIARVDASEAVTQALGEFADKLTAAHLVPVFQPPENPPQMLADGRLTWRVLSNLLSNAVKYALPGTRLYIDLVEIDGSVLISLKNISRDQLNVTADELMERFVRGDASRNTEGSGLGLNIAKSLMELQHGTLRLLIDGDLFKATLVFPKAPMDMKEL